jgi:hypothetical protein
MGLTVSDYVIIGATLLSPLVAVYVIDLRTENRVERERR